MIQHDESHCTEMHKALRSRNTDEGYLTRFRSQGASLEKIPKGQIGVIQTKERWVILGRGSDSYTQRPRKKQELGAIKYCQLSIRLGCRTKGRQWERWAWREKQGPWKAREVTYYGRIFVPPKFICWGPNTKCDGIWSLGLWKVIRFRWIHEGGAPMMELGSL